MSDRFDIADLQERVRELEARVAHLPTRWHDLTPNTGGGGGGAISDFAIGRVTARYHDVAMVEKLTNDPFWPFDEHVFGDEICVWCFSGQLKEAGPGPHTGDWMICFKGAATGNRWVGVVVEDAVAGWNTDDNPERYDCEPTGELPPAAPTCSDAASGSHGVPWDTDICRARLDICASGNYPGGDVTIVPTDIEGDSGGNPDPICFDRWFWTGTQVTLTAPESGFLRWEVRPYGGDTVEYDTPEITITVNTSTVATAVYST